MAISIPSLSSVAARAQSDLQSRIAGATPSLRRSILGALTSALAGALNSLYGYVQQLSLSGVPYTASESALEGWASLWGVTRRGATAASGPITCTGAPGTLIPSETQLQAVNGPTYLTAADATIATGGSVVVTVNDTLPEALGNQLSGAVLSFVSPLVGINSTATVAAGGLVGGTDVETDDQLRARLIAYLANPPQGGAPADYVTWALAVPNITRAWCFPLYAGLGTVRVYVVDDAYAGPGLAAAADVSAAQAALDALKPVGVATLNGSNQVVDGLTVIAPVAQPVNITAADVPNTTDVQAAAMANLQALFLTAQPEGTIKLHQIYKAFLDAPGLTDFNLVSPTADQIATAGNILTLGTITWQ